MMIPTQINFWKGAKGGEWQLQAPGHEVTSRGYFQGIIRNRCHGQQELNPALPGHSSLHAPSTAHSPGATRKFDIDNGKRVSDACRHLRNADIMKPVRAAYTISELLESKQEISSHPALLLKYVASEFMSKTGNFLWRWYVYTVSAVHRNNQH